MVQIETTPDFAVRALLDTIQGLRMIQAVIETGFSVSLDAKAKPVFDYLQPYFATQFTVSRPDDPVIELNMAHHVPTCRIGNLSRPLIFPHKCFYLLRQMWREERQIEISFSGLLTEKRMAVLRAWTTDAFGPRAQVMAPTLFSRGTLRHSGNYPPANSDSKVFIEGSDRGRRWPVKAWDTSYFDVMLSSRYVLCPDGDYVWTYRVFESIMCGAIPIIQNTCEHYKDLVVLQMADGLPPSSMAREIIEHNFAAVRGLITIPTEELRTEIQRLLRDSK